MADMLTAAIAKNQAESKTDEMKDKISKSVAESDVSEADDPEDAGLSEEEKVSKFRIKNIARYLGIATGGAYIALGVIGAITKDGGARVAAIFTIIFCLPFFIIELSYYEFIPLLRRIVSIHPIKKIYDYFLLRSALYAFCTLPCWFNNWTMIAGIATAGVILAYIGAKVKGEKVRAWKLNDPAHGGNELKEKKKKKKEGTDVRAGIQGKKKKRSSGGGTNSSTHSSTPLDAV